MSRPVIRIEFDGLPQLIDGFILMSRHMESGADVAVDIECNGIKHLGALAFRNALVGPAHGHHVPPIQCVRGA